MFFDSIGLGIAPLTLIPVIIGSWYFGKWGGILTAILSVLTNIVLAIVEGVSLNVFFHSPPNVFGSMTLFLLAFVIGTISTKMRARRVLLVKLDKQVSQLTMLHEVALISTQVDSVDLLMEYVTEIIGKICPLIISAFC